ncbi:MAG: hypothetical protein KAH23_08055, partial [Kiritimatiellae bacterium]|nr:hypothetical protein [Kiritimatiellia bacterium]
MRDGADCHINCVYRGAWGKVGFLGVLLLLVLAGLFQRWDAINPSSLWLDDVWVATLARFGTLRFIVMGGVACPPGFVLALSGLGCVFGWGEGTMQFLGLAASLVQVIAIGWLVAYTTGRRIFGVMAAALLVANPVLAIYSARIKPYAIDSFLTVGFVWLAVRVEEQGSLRRFAGLSSVILLASFFSFPSLLTGGVLVGALAIRIGLLPVNEKLSRLLPAMTIAALHGIATVAIYFLILSRHGGSQVHTVYWDSFFLPVTGVKEAVGFLCGKGSGLFWGAFPARATWLALFIPLGLIALIRCPRTRGTGSGIALIFRVVFVLSALRIYPVGAGRTDIFTFPLSILAAVAGIEWVGRRYRAVAPLAIILSIFLFAVELVTVSYSYPAAPERVVASQLSAMRQQGDAVVIHPMISSGVAFYGGWPVRIEGEQGSPIAFVAVPE